MESVFKADILKGKVALVTGGGSGICFEIALQFGKHGAAVGIMGRRKHVLDAAVDVLRSQGIRAIGVEGDVRKQEDAAKGNFLVAAEDLSLNGFKTVLDIDTIGTYNMSHEAFKYLKKGGPGKGSTTGGLILNISATLHYTTAWYQIHVCAAKAAIDSMTRSLALEWGTDHDIRVNGIAPGPIKDTPGIQKLLPEELKYRAGDNMIVERAGEKWDIGMAALYIASDAGKFINGTTLIVDGGYWISRPRRVSKEVVKQISRSVEKKSREPPFGSPSSKL
ncbi:hypothetical protein HPP92_016428 [Vanilla planifolia]|uniref:2,4-dienoyl-CoA reductase [(3E)-enoyl-CoA-producing] n=1 Tax=Vanilla planifolia TaxID=51239 RepID=A0A835QJA7_VANPL|nr:hypothetical protein HPP92_016428 [Vanilla planifolia]